MASKLLKVKGSCEMKNSNHDQHAWYREKALLLPPEVAISSDHTALKHVEDGI